MSHPPCTSSHTRRPPTSSRPSSTRPVERLLSDSQLVNSATTTTTKHTMQPSKPTPVLVLGDSDDDDQDMIVVDEPRRSKAALPPPPQQQGPSASSTAGLSKRSSKSKSGGLTPRPSVPSSSSSSTHPRPSASGNSSNAFSSSSQLVDPPRPKRKKVTSSTPWGGDGFVDDSKQRASQRKTTLIRSTTPKGSPPRSAPSMQASTSTLGVPPQPPSNIERSTTPPLSPPSRPPRASSIPLPTNTTVAAPLPLIVSSSKTFPTPSSSSSFIEAFPPTRKGKERATVEDEEEEDRRPTKASKRRANTSPSPPSTPSIRTILSQADFTHLDPRLSSSVLFQLQYALHGNLSHDLGRKWKGWKATFPSFSTTSPPPPPPPAPLSWATNERTVRSLKKRLAQRDETFVAYLWNKDVASGMRKEVVGGLTMMILSGPSEFPTCAVVLVGTIVGVEEKDDRWWYLLDDGTAVLYCSCIKSPSKPSSIRSSLDSTVLPPSPERKGTNKRSFDAFEEAGQTKDDPDEPAFEIGTLVRIVGRADECHWTWVKDKVVTVERIEVLTDSNAETEHHLRVHKLHEEFYDVPFDLAGKLSELREKEKMAPPPSSDSGMDVSMNSSQGTSSTSGSPNKYRPTDPGKLALSDITPTNFLIYLQLHLKSNFTSLKQPQPDHRQTPRSSPSSAFYTCPTAEETESVPFGIENLEIDKRLRKFAKRLAQKMEDDRLLKKALRAKGVRTVPVGGGGGAWIAPAKEGELRYAREVGKKEGGKEKEGKSLGGEKLEKAVKGIFEEGLRRLRKEGWIVLCDDVEEEEEKEEESRAGWEGTFAEWGWDENGRSAGLPDEPSWGGGGGGSWRGSTAEDASHWGVVEDHRPPPGEALKPGVPVYVNGRWICPPLNDTNSADHFSSANYRAPVSPPTPRANRTSPSTPRKPVPPRFHSSLTNDTSYNTTTSSIISLQPPPTQLYTLVTPSLLSPILLRVIQNLAPRAKTLRRKESEQKTLVVTEHQLRQALARDEKWSKVAEFDSGGVVGKCLELLSAKDEVEQRGVGWVVA